MSAHPRPPRTIHDAYRVGWNRALEGGMGHNSTTNHRSNT